MVGRSGREWAHTAVHAAAREFVFHSCVDRDALTIGVPDSQKCHVLQTAKLRSEDLIFKHYVLKILPPHPPRGTYGGRKGLLYQEEYLLPGVATWQY